MFNFLSLGPYFPTFFGEDILFGSHLLQNTAVFFLLTLAGIQYEFESAEFRPWITSAKSTLSMQLIRGQPQPVHAFHVRGPKAIKHMQ